MRRNKLVRLARHYRFRKARKGVYKAFYAFDRPIPQESLKNIIKAYIKAKKSK